MSLRAWRSEFPGILQFQSPWDAAASAYVFLGRLIGAGQLAFFTKLVLIPKDEKAPFDRVERDTFDRAGVGAISQIVSSQMYFASFLANSGEAAGRDPLDMQSVVLRRWKYVQDHTVDYFRARLIEVHAETEISCKVKDKAPARKVDEAELLPFGLGVAKRRKKDPLPDLAASSKDDAVEDPVDSGMESVCHSESERSLPGSEHDDGEPGHEDGSAESGDDAEP
jgi:hypothetical protein